MAKRESAYRSLPANDCRWVRCLTRGTGRPHRSLDKRFKGSVGTGAVERLATGFRWVEGPQYFPAWRCLIFSDIPNNRMMRLIEDDDHLSVFRSPVA